MIIKYYNNDQLGRPRKRVLRHCSSCKRELEIKSCEIKRRKTGMFFCSKPECKLAWKKWTSERGARMFKDSEWRRIHRNPLYITKTISVVCAGCSKNFVMLLRRYTKKDRVGTKVYCSRKCNYMNRGGINHPWFGKKFPGKGKGRIILKLRGSNNPMFNITRRYNYSSYGYRKDLGHTCRSSWEANYCRILKYLNIKYEYEPITFEMINTSYTPDIKIGSVFIEIKGYQKISSLVKNSEFNKLYPDIRLIIIDELRYTLLAKSYHNVIYNWETDQIVLYGKKLKTILVP